MQRYWKPGLSAFLIVAAALAAPAQTAEAPRTSSGAKVISGAGCVEAGVEAGCLILKDIKTKTTYNLFFTGHRPTVGAAIQFTGTAKSGMTACMQGTLVDVHKWTRLESQAPCASPPREKKPVLPQ